jgi:hypothetical protein
MLKRRRSLGFAVALVITVVACLNVESSPGSSSDAGQPIVDAGKPRDAGADAGTLRDAGIDAGIDARIDAGAPFDGGSAADAGGEPNPPADAGLGRFSFFVTSYKAIQVLSGRQTGFGGNLTFGETGAGAGLRGADKICTTIAEKSMPGSSAKKWRAFLSATADENGKQVNAIDRIGNGPWYDRVGRLLANNKSELISERPINAHSAIKDDFPNEDGVPNHDPDSTGEVDNHEFLTGSNDRGELYSSTSTCKDWTTSDGSASNGKPRVGHSWPRRGFGPIPGFDAGASPWGDSNLAHWISAWSAAGCGAGVNLIDNGAGVPSDQSVGAAGGYGGFYCFALAP